jgi:hypothetical protein
MLMHLALVILAAAVMTLLTFYPFLPGSHDALAVQVSGMAQLVGIAGVLLIPVGLAWLVNEVRRHARKSASTECGGAYYFALAALLIGGLLAVVLVIGAFGSVGPSLALATFAVLGYMVLRVSTTLGLLNRPNRGFHPAPLYLIVVPGAALVAQLVLHDVVSDYGRKRAIAGSASLIRDIERYFVANGHYPRSLSALHQDYDTSVIGVEQFHYAPNGDAYNVFFEQPTFAFANLGVREVVMYNKRDEHAMIGHDSDILRWTPKQLASRRGWNALHDTSIPHWKYFWFD